MFCLIGIAVSALWLTLTLYAIAATVWTVLKERWGSRD